MTAVVLNITIEQGADYVQSFPPILDSSGNAIDISAANIAMQIKPPICANCNTSAIVTLSTATGGLAVNGPAGVISLPGLKRGRHHGDDTRILCI